MPGYYHAASTILHPLDRVQDRLCRELGLSPAEALVKHKLARGDMALLWLLHRIVLGDAAPQLAELFPPARALWVLLARVFKFDATTSSFISGLSAQKRCGAVCSD